MTTGKQAIVNALYAWINQRSGISFADYGDGSAFRAEARAIARDGADARTLLCAVELADGIEVADLNAAFARAFCGRLTWTADGNGGGRLDYTIGQYWPTEYRKAAAAVCARALWDYYADGRDAAGLRKHLRRVFGRGIAGRWFN